MKRRKFFNWFVYDIAKHSEACILPMWGVALHWILFPLKSAYWWLSDKEGYDPRGNVWRINGLEFSGRGLDRLADVGYTFKVVEVDRLGRITLETVDQQHFN